MSLALSGIAGESDLRTIADDLDHPEGVCWDPLTTCIYAGGEAGQLYRVDLEGKSVEVVCTIPGAILLGLAVDMAGTIFACDAGNKKIWRIAADSRFGPFEPVFQYPNYPAFDESGRLWVSDSGSWDRRDGAVYAIDRDMSVTKWPVPALAFANGLAIRAGYLYVVESATSRVVRAPLAGGSLEVVAELPGCVPDGLAFDSGGALLISCFQPNRIYRCPADGSLELVVDDPSGQYVLSPTNITFAGHDLSTLVLASLCGRTLKAIDLPISGAPLYRPAVGEW